jgi:hypothetical protein
MSAFGRAGGAMNSGPTGSVIRPRSTRTERGEGYVFGVAVETLY